MYQHYFKEGYIFINDKDSGKKVYDNISIPSYFAIYYLLETLSLSTELVVILLIFLGIVVYNPSAIFILFIIIVPVFLLVYIMIKNKTKEIGNTKNILYPRSLGNLVDSFNAYSDIKLGNKENYFYTKFHQGINELNKIDALQQGIFGKIHMRLNDVVFGLGLMVIFGYSYFANYKIEQVISVLGVFGISAYRFLPSVNRVMGSFITLKNVSYVIDEIKPLKGKQLYNFSTLEPINFDQKIEFIGINYSYPGVGMPIVLNDISFKINKGEVIGIIGSSGSGKSTLLKIILRFLKENKGKIMVDGRELLEGENQSFQKALGYVQQNVFIQNSTIKHNIAFGEKEEEIDYNKLDVAINDAMLRDYIDSQSKGIETELGENGAKLSGGQKQRIGIARALYKDSQILIFDEATSALDIETEKSIVNAINHLATLDKTIIIVAHRYTTLQMCDKIYELSNGRIERIVEYSELISKTNFQ
jgi:ABC-type bacteriocin/lantibiotic exporter with double-glycine peptidase domain